MGNETQLGWLGEKIIGHSIKLNSRCGVPMAVGLSTQSSEDMLHFLSVTSGYYFSEI